MFRTRRLYLTISIVFVMPFLTACPPVVTHPTVQRTCESGEKRIVQVTVDEGCNVRDSEGNILTDNDYIWVCPGDLVVIKSSPTPAIPGRHWKRSWRSKLVLGFQHGLFKTDRSWLSGRTRVRRAFIVTGKPGTTYTLDLGTPCSESSGSVGTPKIKVGGGG